MSRWMECRGDEWMFIRFFTYLYRVDQGPGYPKVRMSWSQVKKPVLQSLLLLAAGIGGNLACRGLSPWQGLFSVVAVAALPFLVWRLIAIAGRQHRAETAGSVPEADTSVPYLKVGERSIQINVLRPSASGSEVPTIHWTSLKAVELSTLLPPYAVGAPERRETYLVRLEEHVQRLRTRYEGFKEQPQLEYVDRYSLILHHQSGMLSQIPLPRRWMEDGTCDKLLSEIKLHSRLPVRHFMR